MEWTCALGSVKGAFEALENLVSAMKKYLEFIDAVSIKITLRLYHGAKERVLLKYEILALFFKDSLF